MLLRALTLAGIGAIYIGTEGAFLNQRLRQMVVAMNSRYPGAKKISFEENIHIMLVKDAQALLAAINRNIPAVRSLYYFCAFLCVQLLRTRRIGCLIIDSVAALFRGNDASDRQSDRTPQLFQYAVAPFCSAC